MLHGLGISKTQTTPLHIQSDVMVEGYVKMVGMQLSKVVSSLQRFSDELLPTFLLAYRATTCDTTGTKPARMVSEEYCLPCELLFSTLLA
jgi:hypothetical protein